MGYKRAEEILPVELIELIQQYVDGTNIYIPRREGNRTTWGYANNTREKLSNRDENIYREYLEGKNVYELSEKYFLSDKSIWRIIRNMKKAV